MSERDEAYIKANAEANEVFERLAGVIERRVAGGDRSLSVLEIAREAGLEIDEQVLRELQLPDLVPVQRFIPWHVWYPWRPFWCWWWRFHYPWYRCCHWWWYRCHWWGASD